MLRLKKALKTFSTEKDNYNYWVKQFEKNKVLFDNNLNNVKKIIVAFNANIDAITKVDEDFLKKINFKNIKTTNIKIPKEIKSRKDLLHGLAYSIINGESLELEINNEELYSSLLDELKIHTKRMGGQMGIVANHLARIGVNKVIVYNNKLSEEQASLFHEDVLFPKIVNDELKLIPAREAGDKNNPTRINIIIEYLKDTVIEFSDKKIKIPRNNRFIISHKPFRYEPVFPDEIIREELFSDCFRLFLSGFHHATPETSEKIFQKSCSQINNIKSLNPFIKIHVEYVDLHQEWLYKGIMMILSHVDSFGLNEVETVSFLKYINKNKLAKMIKNNDYNSELMAEAAQVILKEIGLQRVNIHHLHYLVCAILRSYGIEKDWMRQANIYAVRIVSSRAIFGKEYLDEHKISLIDDSPLSKKGVKECCSVFRQKPNIVITVVPNKTTKRPVKWTVGLGDVVSSTSFVSEVLFLPDFFKNL